MAVDAEGRGAGPSRVTSNPPSQCERGFASQQLFCFSGEIKRDVRNLAFLAIPPLGKAKCVFRMTICNVTLKGRRRLVFADLCLNRDDFRTVLQQKVDLSCFVRVIARLHLKLPAKLLQDIVLGQRPFQRPFELIVRFQQDGAVVDTRHVLEQPCIKQEQLELIELVKGRKRMFHLGNIIDTIEHTGRNEPFNRFLKIPCPAPCRTVP